MTLRNIKKKRKIPVILIGPTSNDQMESISAVNKSFINHLKSYYVFINHNSNRSFGETKKASFNVVNLFYLFKHLTLWIFFLIKYSPDIAHYAITSHWNLEKSLAFLKISRLFRAKTIGHLHGGAFIDCWNSLSVIRKWIARRELHQLDALVVLSEGWRRAVAEEIGIDRRKIFVVNNPIDQEFEASVVRSYISHEHRTVLSLGVMGKQKGVFDILEGMRIALKSTNFRLQLVGPEREPNIYQKVEDYIQRHSLSRHVEILPEVWGRDKITLFRHASLFLLPSYYENFPLVIIEAAAAGLPIITTPIGALPEFFEHEITAIFVDPGNVEQIANALVDLMENPDKRHRLGAAARDLFNERLSRMNIMKSLRELYENILEV